MGTCKSSCCGESEEQKTEMKMDNNEPVNSRTHNPTAKGSSRNKGFYGTSSTFDDTQVIA